MSRYDFGTWFQGQAPMLTFVFGQNATTSNPGGTPTDPSAGAFLNVSIADGPKTSYPLTHVSAGMYTWQPDLVTPGLWLGTAYAPTGTGKASQPFQLLVQADPTWGP